MNDLQEQIAIEHSIPDMIKKDKALVSRSTGHHAHEQQATGRPKDHGVLLRALLQALHQIHRNIPKTGGVL